MTTLQAIGFTAAGGGVVAAFTFAFFALSVRVRSYNIAPRCTARSKDTIYNPKAKRGRRSFFLFGRRDSSHHHPSKIKKDDDAAAIVQAGDYESDRRTREEVQYRGGPMFGWIPWTLSLSYDQLLTGVPGTGTRKDGMEGSLLKVNLDGIILLRFHALCLRVSILATLIGVVAILPLNLTARCFDLDDTEYLTSNCNTTFYNITNYEQTTLSNIPSLDIGTNNNQNWLHGWFGSSVTIFGSDSSSYLGRLYAVVVFSWILVGYSISLMKKEWVDTLALRRVYYLEGMHWENRIEELNETVLNYESDDSDFGEEERQGAMLTRRLVNKGGKAAKKKKKKRDNAVNRDPWIPHPEQRETVPNIELYSVLVGNIPSLPSEIAAEGDLESMGFSKKQSLDWQLAVTSTFFDQCVPPQPGFSSSVAAVTILPDAPKLAKAWRTWYKHVGLLRRLRFIRSLIAKKRYYEIDEVGEISESDEEANTADAVDTNAPLSYAKSLDILFPLDEDSPKNDVKEVLQETLQVETGSDFVTQIREDHLSAHEEMSYNEDQDNMKQIQQRINYYKDVFGATLDEKDVEMEQTLLMYALEYGPEQTAVYSREFAQGAAACCPNGCREERLHSYELKDLENLEEEVAAALQQSFKDLIEAQNSNVESGRLPDPKVPASEPSTGNLGPIQSAKSLEDMDLPAIYDDESRLYHRTPTKFASKKSAEVANSFHNDEYDARANYPMTSKDEQSLQRIRQPSPQEGSLRLPPDRIFSESNTVVPSRISISNQGRVYFKEHSMMFGAPSGSGDADENSFGNSSYPARKGTDSSRSRNEDWNNGLSPKARQRNNTGFSQVSLAASDGLGQWDRVQQIIKDDEIAKGVTKFDQRNASSGVWKIPTVNSIFKTIRDRVSNQIKDTKAAVDDFASESTFAVVTFTSRQAAIAARHCLADGRGANRWTPTEDIPVPPLADAAAGDLKTCRGCCRPVTMTVNSNQQFVRKYSAWLLLAVIFVFYTFPLTVIANLANPDNLGKILPGLAELAVENPFVDRLLQGLVPAILNSLFFSLCPIMFKAISNFGSNAISVNQAEYIALQYYWTFMVVTAFSGTSLAQLGIAYLAGKNAENDTFKSILVGIAQTLPSQVSANWLNWIILRTFIILPLQYMLQVNTFIFQWLGWKCCRRCVMGGGPGGPVPYRIYIDSGVVFLCIVALSPVSPLVAPASLIYFLYCTPLWRRNCIYMYRPKFDTGGLRWPFLADVLISSLVVAQVLLTTSMALKEAIGPAMLSAIPILPIILHRRSSRKRYLKSYLDCALLQTSQLDGWDNTIPTSQEKRDEYRKFLVDAHKAAYVPICIAGGSTAALTAEPALVVPHENDILLPVPISEMQSGDDLDRHMDGQGGVQPIYSIDRSLTPASLTTPIMGRPLAERAKSQHFASVRRLRPFNYSDQGLNNDSFGNMEITERTRNQ